LTKKIIKIAQAIKKGLIITSKTPKSSGPAFYSIWENDDGIIDHPMHIPAPKLSLPGE
jgi:hypothetical protein